jgi:hypothetical protein
MPVDKDSQPLVRDPEKLNFFKLGLDDLKKDNIEALRKRKIE